MRGRIHRRDAERTATERTEDTEGIERIDMKSGSRKPPDAMGVLSEKECAKTKEVSVI